jgi:hypothetical protein
MAINLSNGLYIAGREPVDTRFVAVDNYTDAKNLINSTGYEGLPLFVKDNNDDPITSRRRNHPVFYVFKSILPAPSYSNNEQMNNKLVPLRDLLDIPEGGSGGISSEDLEKAIEDYFSSNPAVLPADISNAISDYFEDNPVLSETVIQGLSEEEVTALVAKILDSVEFKTEIINVVDADAIQTAIEDYIKENDITLSQTQLDALKTEFFTYVSQNNTTLMADIERAIEDIISNSGIQDQVTQIIENITNETTIENIVQELIEQAGDTFITQIIEEVSEERIAAAVENYIKANPIESLSVTNINGMTEEQVTALVEKILENVEFTQNITTTIINKVDDNTITTIIADYLDTHSISLSEAQLTELKQEFVTYITENNSVLEQNINNAITEIVQNNSTLIQDIVTEVTENLAEQTTIEQIVEQLLTENTFVTQIIEQAGNTFVTQIIEAISEEDIITAVNNYLSKHPVQEPGNGTLSIYKEGALLGSFTANTSEDVSIDIDIDGFIKTINDEKPDSEGNFTLDLSTIKIDIPNEGLKSIDELLASIDADYAKKTDIGKGNLSFKIKTGDNTYQTVQIFNANQNDNRIVDLSQITPETNITITNVNGDWSADENQPGYIANKPTIPIVSNANISISDNSGIPIGSFSLNQPNSANIRLPDFSIGNGGSEPSEPIDLSEYIKSVNNIGPDENGNVEIDITVPGQDGKPDVSLSEILSSLVTEEKLSNAIGDGALTINLKNAEGEIVESTIFKANDSSNKTLNLNISDDYNLEQFHADW